MRLIISRIQSWLELPKQKAKARAQGLMHDLMNTLDTMLHIDTDLAFVVRVESRKDASQAYRIHSDFTVIFAFPERWEFGKQPLGAVKPSHL